MSMTVASRKPARLAVNTTQPLRLFLSYHHSLVPWETRTSRLLPKISNAGRRCFGSQERVATGGKPFAYTWVTKTPKEITPEDVLARIEPIKTVLKEPQSVLLLLVTPGFAPWIDTTSGFLEQCVNKLYGSLNSSSSNSLHLVSAVIDALPDAHVNAGNERRNSLQDEKGSLQSEGISILHLEEADVLGNTTQPRRIRSSGSEREPVLTFSVQSTASNDTNDTAIVFAHEIGLRLANTTFINGNEHTLFGLRWVFNTASGKLEADQSVNLTTCVVRSTANAVRNFFGLPLQCVSQRRKVTSSMGNILSQVAKHADGNSSAGSIPASFELEKELPRYAAEHDIVDQRVSVWALLEKPHCAVPLENEDDSHDRVTESLRAGGKLLRVMSGGGGWGKKQGLLSLDPETIFAEVADQGGLSNIREMLSGLEASPDTEPNSRSLFSKPPPISDLPFLTQLVDPGDYVQFFVSVKPSSLPDRRSELSTDGNGTISLHFGVTTDTEEAVAEVNHKHEKDLVTLPHYFGALSQKAITYSLPVGKGEEEVASSTKLDVPGCRVGLVLA